MNGCRNLRQTNAAPQKQNGKPCSPAWYTVLTVEVNYTLLPARVLMAHTAILARNMNIPAVIGVGEDLLHCVADGDFAAVDGYTGEIFVNPDEETKSCLEKKRAEDEEKKRLLQELKGKENITLDGRKLQAAQKSHDQL